MDPKAYKFLRFVEAECKKHDIKFNFTRNRFVVAGTVKCNGYFDSEERVLAVAGGQPFDKWIKILTHEYGHMTQWLDNCKAWTDIKVGVDSDSEKIVTLWIDKEVSLNKVQKDKHIKNARNVELDCERRTVKLIKKHGLPIDIAAYCKNANAYVYFWSYVGKCRKWYTIGREPYNTPAIVNLMPSHLNCNYDKIPAEVEKLFKGII